MNPPDKSLGCYKRRFPKKVHPRLPKPAVHNKCPPIFMGFLKEINKHQQNGVQIEALPHARHFGPLKRTCVSIREGIYPVDGKEVKTTGGEKQPLGGQEVGGQAQSQYATYGDKYAKIPLNNASSQPLGKLEKNTYKNGLQQHTETL